MMGERAHELRKLVSEDWELRIGRLWCALSRREGLKFGPSALIMPYILVGVEMMSFALRLCGLRWRQSRIQQVQSERVPKIKNNEFKGSCGERRLHTN